MITCYLLTEQSCCSYITYIIRRKGQAVERVNLHSKPLLYLLMAPDNLFLPKYSLNIKRRSSKSAKVVSGCETQTKLLNWTCIWLRHFDDFQLDYWLHLLIPLYSCHAKKIPRYIYAYYYFFVYLWSLINSNRHKMTAAHPLELAIPVHTSLPFNPARTIFTLSSSAR